MSLADRHIESRGNQAAAFARLYRHNDIRHRIAAATPHELVAMLYAGGREALRLARSATAADDGAARVAATSRALRILDALDAALDHGRGGTVARALEAEAEMSIEELRPLFEQAPEALAWRREATVPPPAPAL